MKKWLRILHGFIIINFVAEILYALYMVFFVVGGGRWPLLTRAVETPVEVILKRRLYAIEAWIAIAGLALYLALTEILPRQWLFLQEKFMADRRSFHWQDHRDYDQD